MARPRARELTERELEVMHACWECGEATVADVQRKLDEAGRRLAYTTVATLVRILCEKGFLRQTHDERPYRFEPVRSFDEVSGSLLGDLLERVFGGSREMLLVRLLEQRRLTAQERRLLEEILQQTKKPGSRGSGGR